MVARKHKGPRSQWPSPKHIPSDELSPTRAHLLKFHPLMATLWTGNQALDLRLFVKHSRSKLQHHIATAAPQFYTPAGTRGGETLTALQRHFCQLCWSDYYNPTLGCPLKPLENFKMSSRHITPTVLRPHVGRMRAPNILFKTILMCSQA